MNVIRKNLLFVFATLILTGFLFLSLNAQTKDEEQTPIPPKKVGVKRIGVILPKVKLNNVSKKTDPAKAVRNSFITLLNSEEIEVIPLNSSLDVIAIREALKKECDYILRINLVQKGKRKSGSFFNRILDKSADSAITDAASRTPTGNNVGGRIGREAVRGAGEEVTEVEFTIKKKDEFILDYDLSIPKGESATKNSIKAKAQKDNDNLLSPLIERAAGEIAEYIFR